MTASARQHSPKRVPHLLKPIAEQPFRNGGSATLRLASGLSFAPRSSKGEEAATPEQPVAQSAFLEVPPGNSLTRIAGDRWLCRNHSAQPGILTFRCTHSPSLCCGPQVKNLAPLCRNCGRRDFPVEVVGNLRQNFARQQRVTSVLNNLHAVKIIALT